MGQWLQADLVEMSAKAYEGSVARKARECLLRLGAYLESPIEAVFLGQLLAALDLVPALFPVKEVTWSSWRIGERLLAEERRTVVSVNVVDGGTRYRVDVAPQVKVGNYRIDFLVAVTKVRRDGAEKQVGLVAIECVSHEYHSSGEQMSADALRERWLTLHGFHVVRFTGREINGTDRAGLDAGMRAVKFLWNVVSNHKRNMVYG